MKKLSKQKKMLFSGLLKNRSSCDLQFRYFEGRTKLQFMHEKRLRPGSSLVIGITETNWLP